MPIRSLTRAGDRAGGVIRDLLRLQSAGGILLMPMAVIALVLANTRAEGLYQAFLDTPVEIRIDALTVAKPLVLWINDGQMAVFFFLVGLEIKRNYGLIYDSRLGMPFALIAGTMASAK